jgi:hypothetical protein
MDRPHGKLPPQLAIPCDIVATGAPLYKIMTTRGHEHEFIDRFKCQHLHVRRSSPYT